MNDSLPKFTVKTEREAYEVQVVYANVDDDKFRFVFPLDALGEGVDRDERAFIPEYCVTEEISSTDRSIKRWRDESKRLTALAWFSGMANGSLISTSLPTVHYGLEHESHPVVEPTPAEAVIGSLALIGIIAPHLLIRRQKQAVNGLTGIFLARKASLEQILPFTYENVTQK